MIDTTRSQHPVAPIRCDLAPLTAETLAAHYPRIRELDAGIEGERWSDAHWQLELPGKWTLSRLLFVNAVVAGFVVASVKPGGVHIHRLAVAREYRGQRLGEVLVRAVARAAAHEGHTQLTLKVADANTAARRLYDRLGFSVAGHQGTNVLMAAACAVLAGA